MPFKASHVSFVSFALEVQTSGISQVMIVETDLHLNARHPAYDSQAVNRLLSAAQDYANASMQGLFCIRLVSNRNGQV